MTVTVNNEATNGAELVYTENPWTGRRDLSYDGTALKRINNKTFALEGDAAAEFTVEGNRFKGVRVSSTLFAAPIEVVRKLTVLEYILAVLVFIPGLVFGAVGGAIGGAIGAINFYVMPRIETPWLKITVAIEFAVVAGFAAFWTAYGVGMLFW